MSCGAFPLPRSAGGHPTSLKPCRLPFGYWDGPGSRDPNLRRLPSGSTYAPDEPIVGVERRTRRRADRQPVSVSQPSAGGSGTDRAGRGSAPRSYADSADSADSADRWAGAARGLVAEQQRQQAARSVLNKADLGGVGDAEEGLNVVVRR